MCMHLLASCSPAVAAPMLRGPTCPAPPTKGCRKPLCAMRPSSASNASALGNADTWVGIVYQHWVWWHNVHAQGA